MKNTILALVITTLLSGCAFLKNRYAQEPEINLQSVYLQEAQVFSATMVIVLSVKNPNKIDLTVDEVSYEVQLNNQEFTKSKLDKKTIIPAGETKLVEIPLPVNYLKALNGIGKILSGEDMTYLVSGTAKVSGFSIPFKDQGTLNIQELKEK
ncbi:MAG: LEA type 2 family protein [Bacillota bacterium]